MPRSPKIRRHPVNPSLAQGLDVGLRVLECFLGTEKELGVTEISRRMGLYKSRTHKALRTLVSRRFLEQDPASRKYRLGVKLFELGRRVPNFEHLRDLALPVLKPLAAGQRATVFLRVADPEDGTLITVAAVESPDQVRLIVLEGEQRPIHYGAIGKVLLAGYDQSAVRKLLEKAPLRAFTRQTIVSTDSLLRELDRVRRRGYATNRDESLPGVKAVAAPVLDAAGKVVGAIGLGRPSAQFPESDFDPLGRAVLHAALELSRKLGFSGPKLTFPAPSAPSQRKPVQPRGETKCKASNPSP